MNFYIKSFDLCFFGSKKERIDTLNLHIFLGRKENKDVQDLIKLRERRYLI